MDACAAEGTWEEGSISADFIWMTGSRRIRVVKREGWSRASFVLDGGGKRKKGEEISFFF